nr:hypothetical protein GCM10020063_009840 [Dactylosporangium thailandense]
MGGSTITPAGTGRRAADIGGQGGLHTLGSGAVARVPCGPVVRRRRRRRQLNGAAAAAIRHVAASTNVHVDPEEVVLMRTAVSDAPFAGPSADVVDTALWLHGAFLVELHRADPVTGSGCVEAACRTGGQGTCWVRPFARRLMVASSGAWVQRWTARHDARSCGLPVLDVLVTADRSAPAVADDAERWDGSVSGARQ